MYFLFVFLQNKKKKAKNIFHILAFDINTCFSIFLKNTKYKKIFCMHFGPYNKFIKLSRI